MPMASILRRLERVEGSGLFTPPVDYPPLSISEIEEFARRARDGDRLSREESDRLQQHSPIVGGEVLMTAYRGQVVVKRYPGVDLSEI